MSSMSLLFGLPEILIQILASCDTFAQAVALSSTCKDVYAVWLSNTSPILDRVGRQRIPAFDEAVVAARAIEIVKSAILNRKLLLKDIDIAQLSTAVFKPQLVEISGIVALQCLVELTERSYLDIYYPLTRRLQRMI